MEYIHSRNYIHRDVKPENFLVECEGDCSELFAIDFGLAKLYRSPPKLNHIPYRIGKPLIGTARYTSISTHLGCEQSRRDDLEAIIYMSLYFMKGNLPWMGLKVKDKRDMNKQMLDLKQNTPLEILCEGLPGEIAELLSYVRRLKFDEDPDYKKMQSLLEGAAKSVDVSLDKNYDWVKIVKKRMKKNTAEVQSQSEERTESCSEELKIPRKELIQGMIGEEKQKDDFSDKAMVQSLLVKGSQDLDNPVKKGNKSTKKENVKKSSGKSRKKEGKCNII